MRTRRLRLVVLGSVLAGCGSVDVGSDDDASPGAGADAAPGEADAAGPDGSPAGGVVLRYDFDQGLVEDGGARYVPDVGGADRRGLVVGAVGGEALLEAVAREGDAGMALRFPGECAEPEPMDCPRVILEATETADQNPGQRGFRRQRGLPRALAAGRVDHRGPERDAEGQLRRPRAMEGGDRRGGPSDVRLPLPGRRRRAARRPRPARGQRRCLAQPALRAQGRRRRHQSSTPARARIRGRSTSRPGTRSTSPITQAIRIGGQNVMASADQFHGSLDDVSVEIF